MNLYDENASIYPIDPSRTDLVKEFKAHIRGPYSEELRRVLHRMRTMPLKGRHVLVVRVPFREWVVGRLSGERGKPVAIDESQVFRSLDEAEWAVFKLRWQELTGRALEL